MLILKILGIAFIVFFILFLCTLIIYFFNLDMKFAAAIVPILNKWHDFAKRYREKKKDKAGRMP